MSTENKQLPITPLPWKLTQETEGFGGETSWGLRAAHGFVLCNGGFSRTADYGFGRETEYISFVRIPNPADATYIIEAVNNYQNLKDACVRKDALIKQGINIMANLEAPIVGRLAIISQRNSWWDAANAELQTSGGSALSPSLQTNEERAICDKCGGCDWWMPDDGPVCNKCGGRTWHSGLLESTKAEVKG